MHQDNLAYSAVNQKAAVDEMPRLPDINERFQKENIRYQELVIAIQERLHNIVNMRTPEKQEQSLGNTRPQILNSFEDAANENLRKLYENNNRLEKVLQHVKRLV